MYNENVNPVENLGAENTQSAQMFYPEPTAEEKEKKEIKKLANTVGFSFLLVMAAILTFSFGIVFALSLLGFSQNKVFEFLEHPIISQAQQIFFSITVFTLPFIIIFKAFRYRISDLISFGRWKKGQFLPFFLTGVGFCAFANIAVSIAGQIFESFGIDYNVDYGEKPTGVFGFLLSLLATVVVPALVEEFSCRGIVLGALKKCGNGFAIVVSAILFGLMHGNFEQMPFAFLVGLVLGFVTVKSGTIWIAVLIHAFNNSISLVFEFVLSHFSELAQNAIYTVFLIISLILGITGIVLLKNEEFTEEKSDTKNSLTQKIKWFMLSVPVIIYTVLCFIESMAFFA